MTALAPNATIGILGGGQLGRMLALAAARLGYRCHIFDPATNGPATQVAVETTIAAFDNDTALLDFAQSVDVVTYEWENIPTEALGLIGNHAKVYPPVAALSASQDRLTEKSFLASLGLRVAPFADLSNATALDAALAAHGEGIIKTRRFGYDGKGQLRVKPNDDLTEAYAMIADTSCIFEGFVNFNKEISVIAARAIDGAVSVFDPGENAHETGILRVTTVPAEIPASMMQDAVLLAGRILSALDYVGVVGVELFVTTDGLVVNEIAPRVHNTGHWTQNGCVVDQFEQHIRAITGLPLGDGRRHSDIRMENLIGNDMERLPALISDSNAAVHLYGKAETRAGRKNGPCQFLDQMIKNTGPRLAVRAVIIREKRVLLVNAYGDHRHELWALPGGGVAKHSDLASNLQREVFEETGLTVTVGEMVGVNEFHDVDSGFHQVDLYYRCRIVGDVPARWHDQEGVVSRYLWATREDVQSRNVKPTMAEAMAFDVLDWPLYDPLESIIK